MLCVCCDFLVFGLLSLWVKSKCVCSLMSNRLRRLIRYCAYLCLEAKSKPIFMFLSNSLGKYPTDLCVCALDYWKRQSHNSCWNGNWRYMKKYPLNFVIFFVLIRDLYVFLLCVLWMRISKQKEMMIWFIFCCFPPWQTA